MHTAKRPSAAGFEPTREIPSGFQVHRLNHSAKLTSRSLLYTVSAVEWQCAILRQHIITQPVLCSATPRHLTCTPRHIACTKVWRKGEEAPYVPGTTGAYKGLSRTNGVPSRFHRWRGELAYPIEPNAVRAGLAFHVLS